MAIVHFSDTTKNSMLTPLRTAIDAGGAAGTIKLYTGTMAADTSTAITTQTLLGTLAFSYNPCGTVAAGVLTMGSITQDSSADATGTATWARIQTSGGTVIMDIDVTNSGGGGSLQLNTVSIVIGGPILITAFAVSIP